MTKDKNPNPKDLDNTPETQEEDILDDGVESETSARFTCPDCGEITRDEVLFICNQCESDEIIHRDGLYICPQCLYPGENFECLTCGNKHVAIQLSE